ncbi:MAG: ATP-binding protein, partial [Tannerellaceae bacterium]|nr:ATP-binding protein [Tannerellaceae bacterium]
MITTIPKQFNVAGPCNPAWHYMIDPARRLAQAETSIRRGDYFVIHAARQSGKTTYLQDIVRRLNAQGDFYALYCSLEAVQNVADPKEGIPAILDCFKNDLAYSSFPNADSFGKEDSLYTSALQRALANYCRWLDKPLVILFDEADCLADNTLISFLRQIRAGYVGRNTGTP